MVAELFGVTEESRPDCIICRSEHRREIDRVIASREEAETWRPVIRKIRERFGLKITTPQTLIGHEKYHTGCTVGQKLKGEAVCRKKRKTVAR